MLEMGPREGSRNIALYPPPWRDVPPNRLMMNWWVRESSYLSALFLFRMGFEVFVQYLVSVLHPMLMNRHEPVRLTVESKCRAGDGGKIIVSYYQNSISSWKSCSVYVLVCLVRCYQSVVLVCYKGQVRRINHLKYSQFPHGTNATACRPECMAVLLVFLVKNRVAWKLAE